eukprot:TRINITY_DN42922_c0_g1_i1.p1 TRINITY_DN42922_c0_g1~~TRINITY_DN42922_c0_g1_i1.p1  ORF type:complete len:112 (+),score=10.91 TRINITY_DN42922_c0_g1_i1:49-336(+)
MTALEVYFRIEGSGDSDMIVLRADTTVQGAKSIIAEMAHLDPGYIILLLEGVELIESTQVMSRLAICSGDELVVRLAKRVSFFDVDEIITYPDSE